MEWREPCVPPDQTETTSRRPGVSCPNPTAHAAGGRRARHRTPRLAVSRINDDNCGASPIFYDEQLHHDADAAQMGVVRRGSGAEQRTAPVPVAVAESSSMVPAVDRSTYLRSTSRDVAE
ncbi:hypothetical protein E2562_018125 [Oryza meyeriana var. granulata]|uniref:Uncharacterized protein n=1 Tax=Oryza meyeriana var. granulata TaxID=110450 RepID=A0A6G1C758_9ORYZ|nr:hypothetical protein E2562_018125 [Oryza meyeriana var. granulata]